MAVNLNNPRIDDSIQRWWQALRLSYKDGDALTRLAYIDLAVFVAAALANALLSMAGLPQTWIRWVALPASLTIFLTRPWTLLTYSFFHDGLLHILLNILALLWTNRLLRNYFPGRRNLTLFLTGTLAGALAYWAGYYAFPSLSEARGSALLVGASAGIMAMLGLLLCYDPKRRLRFSLFGEVPLSMVCLVLIFLTIAGGDPGGTLAHAGGLTAGVLWALRIRLHGNAVPGHGWWQGIRMRMQYEINKNYNRSQASQAPKSTSKENPDPEMEAILDKLRKSGYDGLSEDEKRKLFRPS